MSRKSYRVTFAGGNGADLAGIIDRPSSLIDAPVAVFSHCFTCNKDLKAIVRVARSLADAGIAVLRFDMTGLGGSEGNFGATSFTTNLADLAAAIRFAGKELGTVTALIGHSFGGAASLALAGGAGERQVVASVRAVVSLAAPSDTTHLAELLVRMNPDIEAVGSGTVTIGGKRWEIPLAMVDDFRRHDLAGWSCKISVPTLLFHSPVDSTVSFDHALRTQGLIQAGDRGAPVSLITLAGADHLLVDDPRDLEFVAQTASAFLRRYASPAE